MLLKQTEIEEIIRYSFHNKDLLDQAYPRQPSKKRNHDNQVLEYIGDTILSYYLVSIICEQMKSFQHQENKFNPEQELDDVHISGMDCPYDFEYLKRKFLTNQNLADRMEILGLANPEHNTKTKADIFEAIIGAIAIDSNFSSHSLAYSINHMLNLQEYLDRLIANQTTPAMQDLFDLAESHHLDKPLIKFSKIDKMHRCTIKIKEYPLTIKMEHNTAYRAKRKAAETMIIKIKSIENLWKRLLTMCIKKKAKQPDEF